MTDLKIRRARESDIPQVEHLLHEVLEVHAKIRPDIFQSGSAKYSEEDLKRIFRDPEAPVFVAAEEHGNVLGYLFGILQQSASAAMRPIRTLYIDDLCVEENSRGLHIGRQLYEYALAYAREQGCYDVTLNVWEGNDRARAFYEKLGMRVKETQMETIL